MTQVDTTTADVAGLRRFGLPALEGALVLALLLVALIGPGTTLTIVAVGLLVAVMVRRPQLSVLLAGVLAFTTFPGFVPVDMTVAGYSVHAFEPFLLFAGAWSLLRLRAPAWANIASASIFAVVVLWAVWGLVQHNPPAKIVFDVRPLMHLVLASAIAPRVVELPVARWLRRALPWMLWFSAAMTFLASTTGFAITGSSEQATLYLGDATSDATRLRGPTTDLALLVLSVCIALFIARRTRNGSLLLLGVPAFLIVFLAFSRYTVIGVGFAVVCALIAARSPRALFNGVLLVAITVFAGLSIGVLAPRIASVPGGDWVVTQVSGFEGRVLGGLTGQVIAEDGSAQFRLQEDAYLTPRFEQAPFIGHGFGFAYKPPQGPAGSIFDQYAPYYAHNWYLWILVKSGVVGAGVLLAAIGTPVLAALWRPTPRRLVLAIATGVLMVDSIVAPMPNADATATLVGTVLGLLIAAVVPGRTRTQSRSEPSRSTSPGRRQGNSADTALST